MTCIPDPPPHLATRARRLGVVIDADNVSFEARGPRFVARLQPTSVEGRALAVLAATEPTRFAVETEDLFSLIVRDENGRRHHLRDFAARNNIDPDDFSVFVTDFVQYLKAAVDAAVASAVSTVNTATAIPAEIGA